MRKILEHLGLACEMDASGTQRSEADAEEPLAFGYSWVELYVHAEGRWWRSGNASSAKD